MAMTVWSEWLFSRTPGATRRPNKQQPARWRADRPSYGGRNNPSYSGHYQYLGGLGSGAGEANVASLQKIRLHMTRSD